MLSYLLQFKKRPEFACLFVCFFFFSTPSKIPTCTSQPNSLKICNICILPQSKTYTQITVFKSLGFSALKYTVLTFCWHSIEAPVAFAGRSLSRFLGSLLAHTFIITRLVSIKHRGLWNMDHASSIIPHQSNLNWKRCICTLEWQKDLQQTSSHVLLFNTDVSPFGFLQCIYKIQTYLSEFFFLLTRNFLNDSLREMFRPSLNLYIFFSYKG